MYLFYLVKTIFFEKMYDIIIYVIIGRLENDK